MQSIYQKVHIMAHDIDLFIEDNKYNISYEKALQTITCMSPDVSEPLFHELFEQTITFDNTISECTPVYVYEHAGKLVAWYDTENYCGYMNK